MIAAIGLVVGMVIAFIVTEPVIRLITIPIIDVAALRGDTVDVQVMFTTVTSPFDLRIRIALAIGLLLSAPVWLWQVWAFIMPGLTRKEIGYTVGFVNEVPGPEGELHVKISKPEGMPKALEVVRNNFPRYGLLDEQVRFLPGWFADTLPAAPVSELAVLRL
ncbi:twin-arginine translocase subunit TatC, partial [Agromyces lapidis]